MRRWGIVGHRSWISQALMRWLDRVTDIAVKPEISVITKSDFSNDLDLSEFDCVFMIAGRARPTTQERTDEIMLVSRLPSLTKPPKRLVYFSSLAVEREPTPYAQMKMACEAIVLACPWGAVLRPPVIFGVGQDPKADMLIPQLARHMAGKEHLVLRQPFLPFHLMHVDDVCLGAWQLGNRMLHNDNRVLRLLSDLITPVEIITACMPGSPFYAMEGWKTFQPSGFARDRPGEDWRYWNAGMPRIKETIEKMAEEIMACDTH